MILSKIANRLFWCALIVIKINVIEDMKFRLTQYEAFHRKMKRKFWPHPRIINLYTLYILGTDKESFLEDLHLQEHQVNAMINGSQFPYPMVGIKKTCKICPLALPIIPFDIFPVIILNQIFPLWPFEKIQFS